MPKGGVPQPKAKQPAKADSRAKQPTGKKPTYKTSGNVKLVRTDSAPLPILGGFGARLERPISSMYMGNPSTGAVTTKKELGICVTDFFEYGVGDPSGVPQFVTNYFWEINQNLFDNNSSFPGDLGEDTWCRVRSVKVWVLPLKGFNSVGGNPSSATSNTDAVFTVNCQTPGVAFEPVPGAAPSASDRTFAMNTQVTNCLPQIDTHWKQVFSCNLQKTFRSGVARPFIQSFGALARSQAQCIFQMSIVDPDTGKPYIQDDNLTIKVKVQLMIDQPIATLQQAAIAVFRNEEFTSPALEQNGTPYSPPTPSYVQMNLRSVLDHMS